MHWNPVMKMLCLYFAPDRLIGLESVLLISDVLPKETQHDE